MPCSDRVGRQQDIARPQDKRIAVPRRKLERARQSDDLLVARGRMPVERRACGGLLEMRRRRGLLDTQRNIKLFDMGPAVGAGEQMDAANHA